MKRASAAVTIAAIALWSAPSFAQGRDFAGSWTIDAEKTAAANASGGGGRGGFGGGGGGAARSSAGAGAAVAGGGGGGGRGGAVGRIGGSPAPTLITLDATTFTVGAGEVRTTYRLDGSPTTIERPTGTMTAKAAWVGDKLTIQTTADTPDGTVSTTTVWYLEGDSLVRETSAPGADGQTVTRKTYFKRV